VVVKWIRRFNMTYFEAESMRQEINVALQYREFDPDGFKEVAKKYTTNQWAECGKAIIEKLEDDKIHLFELLTFVEKIRRMR
jgi:hypothetical protein